MSDHQDESNSNNKPFQVVDRRRFDAAGNERSETPASSAGTDGKPAGTGSPKGEIPRGANREGGVGSTTSPASEQTTSHPSGAFRMEAAEMEEGDVTFTSFIMSMATQTLVQMGEMEPPPGMEIPIDVPAARQTIDILSMLQRKTRGNLSSEEARFMEEVLHTLRMSYVRKAR